MNLIPAMEKPANFKKKAVVNVFILKGVAEQILLFKRNYKGQAVQFTQYLYEVVMNGTSQYTPLIYPLISSWKEKGGFEIGLDELRRIVGMKEGQYAYYRDFKKRVLEPVQKDLYKKADCWYNCAFKDFEIREGKKVMRLKFKVITPEVEELHPLQKQAFIQALKRFSNFTNKDIEQLNPLFEAQIPIERLSEKMMELDRYFKDPRNTRQITNPQAYIIKSLLKEFL
jgi:plasmid replication initiation protein